MDKGAWWVIIHGGHKESDITEQQILTYLSVIWLANIFTLLMVSFAVQKLLSLMFHVFIFCCLSFRCDFQKIHCKDPHQIGLSEVKSSHSVVSDSL